MVVGIEMNASAVSDAHRNAEINGIKNCRFVCAKAEDVMRSLLKEYLNMPQMQDGLQMPLKPTTEIFVAEEKAETFILASQHYIVMLGTIVLIPNSLVPRMGGDHGDKVWVIQTLLFMTLVNTLLQSLFGTRPPTVMSASFTFVLPAITIISDFSDRSMSQSHLWYRGSSYNLIIRSILMKKILVLLLPRILYTSPNNLSLTYCAYAIKC